MSKKRLSKSTRIKRYNAAWKMDHNIRQRRRRLVKMEKLRSLKRKLLLRLRMLKLIRK